MHYQLRQFDAFSGMNSLEQTAIINLIQKHGDQSPKSTIRAAIGYAMKQQPSFGGFILSFWHDRDPIAAVVVNRTGMEAFNPQHLLVYAVLHQDYQDQEQLLTDLLNRAIQQAKGDIALHLRPNHPALPFFKKLGFEEQFVELRRTKASA